MAELRTHPDGMLELTMRDPMFTDGTSADLMIMPSGDAEIFLECGNCCGTAGSRITDVDLRELRDFLNEHVKG